MSEINTTTKIKLYSSFSSPCCQMVLMVLEELNLDYEIIPVDFQFEFTNYSEWFALINDKMTVPVMDFDGHIMSETNEIIAHLSQNTVLSAEIKLLAKYQTHFETLNLKLKLSIMKNYPISGKLFNFYLSTLAFES